MVYFNEIGIIVDGSGIIATSAGVQVNNSLLEIKSLGKGGVHGIDPNGPVEGTIKIDYLPQLCNEQVYEENLAIKSLSSTGEYNGITIIIGGITGYNCFLENHSYNIQPNQTVRASASFKSYNLVSGDIKVSNAGITFNEDNSFMHGWTTYVLSTGLVDYYNVPSYELNYSASFEWEPIYKIGEMTPSEVKFLAAEETITVTRDDFKNISFTGDLALGQFWSNTNSDNVQFLNIAFLCNTGVSDCYLNINVSGAKVTNSNMSVSLDDMAKTVTTIRKFY